MIVKRFGCQKRIFCDTIQVAGKELVARKFGGLKGEK